MPPRHKKAPKYRLHKQSGLAIVTVRMPGMKPRDMTLGPYNSTESIDRYKEVLTSIQLGHDPTVTESKFDCTVAEVIVAFWKHAEQHYRRARPSRGLREVLLECPLRDRKAPEPISATLGQDDP